MTDRTQMMIDILLGIQNDLGLIKREQALQGSRLPSIEEFLRGTMAPVYGIRANDAVRRG